MRRDVEPEPRRRTAGSPSTSAGQAASRSGFRRLVPAASENRSRPSTGGSTRTGVTDPSRRQAAKVASSCAISQPFPSGAMPDAAVTGVPSSNRNALTPSTKTRMRSLCPAATTAHASGGFRRTAERRTLPGWASSATISGRGCTRSPSTTGSPARCGTASAPA